MEQGFKHVLPYFPRRTCLPNRPVLSLYGMQPLPVPICHLQSKHAPRQLNILHFCQGPPQRTIIKYHQNYLPCLPLPFPFLQPLPQAPILLIISLSPDMSLRVPKNQTSSFKAPRSSELRNSSQKFGYSPDKSESRIDRTSEYGVRFKRKDLREFQPELYITGSLNYQDVLDLKEVFDAYDSTGMGVLLPNDLKLLLTQNGFNPNRKTTYEVVAEFDVEEAGGISFIEFMKAMDTKPYRNETKKEIAAIFKKYDRDNKNYLTIDDFREVNNHVKENLDEETLRLMVEKADSNRDGKVSFEDFYSVMIKDIY